MGKCTGVNKLTQDDCAMITDQTTETSLREEFLNSSSKPLNEFYELTTTSNSGLKRASQIHYLDLVETNSQFQSQVKKIQKRKK